MTAEEADPAGALPGHCVRHSCQQAHAVGLSCAMISTSDVALGACHSPGHSSSYPEQSSGAATPSGTGLSGSALCCSLAEATGEEAQTGEDDLASDLAAPRCRLSFVHHAGSNVTEKLEKCSLGRWKRKERNNLIMNILCRHVMPLACWHGLISINQRGRSCF